MTEYHTIKKLITKISTLDHSHHYDIFNILCRYNMTYSKNSNGFFFDFQNLDENVVRDISDFISSLESNAKSSFDCSQESAHTNESSETTLDGITDRQDHDKTLKKTSLADECLQTVIQLNVVDEVPISALMSALEKDRVVTKRTTSNRFTLAKKKYSKPVANEIKYTMSDILVSDF